MRIDSHQHFWNYDPVREGWIDDEMQAIRKDFLPGDLKPLLDEHNIDGCIAVQSDQSEVHNEFLLKLADKNPFIKGIVGWVDLQANNVDDRLAFYSQHKSIKGFRHVLQGEQDRALMLKPSFLNGIGVLSKYNYTYDILIFPDQLQYIPEFVSKFPDQKFVIDHLAKPYIKAKKIEDWKADIIKVAQYKNVSCKVSGMLTEADYNSWKKEDFTPYLDVVVEAFGPDRLMYGSDWPVCLVAASYNETINLVEDYFKSFTTSEQQAIFGLNAENFYNLQ